MDSTYPASYQGYQEWYSNEETQFEDLLSNTTLASEHPMAYIMAILGFMMSETQAMIGWSGVEINGASKILNVVSNLQGAFSSAASSESPTSSQESAIQDADELYQQLETVPKGSPFYDVAQTVMTQFKAIFPPGWTFATTSIPYSSATEDWYYQWQSANMGNTSYITSTNTDFSNAISSVNGASSEFQSENKYYGSNDQEWEGLFNDTTQSVNGVESQSVSNQNAP